jgi:putative peptidoglycan lipid II flippase
MAFSANQRAGSGERPLMRAEMKALLRNSRAAACGTLVSRITGFGRMAAAASVLGPTFFGNLFQTIAILPGAIYLVLIGSLISAVLVPPLVRRMNEGGRAELERFAGAVLGLMLMILLGIGLLTALAAPALLRALTFTVADPGIRREQVRLGLPLLLMLIPQTALYGVAGTGMAVQQAHGRFALAAFAPALENLINIAVLVASAVLFGVGVDVDRITVPQLLLLGIGTTGAVSVHAAVQWFGAYRVGVPLVPRLGWGDADVRQILRRGVASMGYVGLDYAGYLLTTVIVGTIPGGVAALQITNNFCKLPVALAATPLASAQLPQLSSCHQRHEMQDFGSLYESGLRLVIFMAAPAALILIALPRLLAGAAAFGAMNTPSSIGLITACLAGQGVGVIGDAVFMLTTTASYARHDTTTPLRASAMRLALISIGATVVMVAIRDRDAVMWAIGASSAVANLAAGSYLCRRLRAALPSKAGENTGLISASAISAIALMPALLLSQQFSEGANLATYQRVWFALGSLILTAVVYLAIQHLRGSRELRLLLPALGQPAVNP